MYIRVFLKGHFVKKKMYTPPHITGGYLERSYPEGGLGQTSPPPGWNKSFAKICLRALEAGTCLPWLDRAGGGRGRETLVGEARNTPPARQCCHLG